MGLRIITLTSPWMSSPPHQILWKTNKWFRSWWRGQAHTHRDRMETS
jgi:hypothetical protein